MAKILYADGRSEEIKPANGKTFTLEEMQDVVGGFIEICETNNDDQIMIINEEGKVYNLPYNAEATRLYRYNYGDCIVGDVLLCDSLEVE